MNLENASIYKLRKLYEYFENNTDIKTYITQVSGAKFSRNGKNWKCRSPLNSNDKNPSFTVTEGKQVFYCFSTGYGGNIVSFAERFYSLDRDSAIAKIASDMHIDLSDFVSDESSSLVLYSDILNKALEYCIKTAKTSDIFADFFSNRGIGSVEFLLSNRVGYCDSSMMLGDFLSVSGCDMSIVESLGLLSDERMTNSVVFPVWDEFNNIVRFVCRPMNGNVKYINTNEYSTSSSDVLMGVNSLKAHNGKDPVVVVEGAIDYLALKYAGYDSVVAMCGLKLPHTFMNRVSRLNYSHICLWVDGDTAGKRFVYKVFEDIDQYSKSGVLINVVLFDGEDPDAVIRRHNMKEIIDGSVYLPIWAVNNRLLSIEDKNMQMSYVIKSGINLTGVGYQIYLDWAGGMLNTPKDAIHYSISSVSKRAISDVESEKVLLSTILYDKSAAGYYGITPDIFYIPQHKRIAMMAIVDGMSFDSIYYSFKDDQHMINTMNSLSIVSHNGVFDVVKSLKKLHQYRNIHNMLLDGIKKIPSYEVSPEDILQEIEDKISSIQNQSDTTMENGTAILVQIIDDLFTRSQSSEKLMLLGDGWKRVNSIVFGLVLKKLYIIQAPTGHGKTTLVLNWINDLTIESGIPVLFFSGEMDKMEIGRRLVSMQTGINNTSLSYTGASDSDMEVMFDLVRSGKGFDKLYVENTMDFSKVCNIIKYSVRRHGVKYVVIDYVQLLELSGARFKDMQTYEKYKEVSRHFKVMAQSLNITIMILGQQNDEALDDKTPMGRRLAGAKSMQNDADVVIAFRKKTMKEINDDGIEKGNLIINIDKVRYNQSQVMFHAYMNPSSLKIREV